MDLNDKALLVSLHQSKFGGTKHDKSIEKKVEQDLQVKQKIGNFNKYTIAKDALKEIQNTFNNVYLYHRNNTLPWSNEGSRILPSAHYFEYVQNINELKTKAMQKVEEFVLAYPDWVEEAKNRLLNAFNPNDYPPAYSIREKFDITVDFYPIPNPKGLYEIYSIEQSEIDNIAIEMEEKLKKTMDTAMKEPLERVISTIKHMIEKLQSDGRIFKSVFSNIEEICNLFQKLYLGNDQVLLDMIQEVREMSCGVDVEEIKDNKIAKTEVEKKAEELFKKLEGYSF
jgi:hypothetical protein